MSIKLLIDSEEINLGAGEATNFKEYCNQAMQWLIQKNRSIANCKLNGNLIASIEQADDLFPNATLCEIESLPLFVALESSLALQCAKVRRMEEECEKLVTDSLLSEPQEIVNQWSNLCEEIKELVGFIPRLNALLTEEQVEHMVNKNFEEIKNIMRDISDCFKSANMVGVSDILELQLQAWLKNLREFMHSALKLVETMQRKTEL